MPHLKNKTVENAVAALLALQTDSNNEAIDYNRDTKKTVKFNETLELKELSPRLVDTTVALLDHCKILTDTEISGTKKDESIKKIRKTIVPFLDITATNVMNASNKLAPIAGSYYVHNTDEVERKKEYSHPMDRISSCVFKKRKAESRIVTPDRMRLRKKGGPFQISWQHWFPPKTESITPSQR